MTYGWVVPPPTGGTKNKQQLHKERAAKVEWLVKRGFLRSEPIKQALLKVCREDFIPQGYRDYAYEEVPLPLPGENATISCPHSYPLFYEPLGLANGHRFLEIGLGSGYGTAIAREVVGAEGLVVAMEIDKQTFKFAKKNLARAGYTDLVLVHEDGGLGYPALSSYDRIAVTAACPKIPAPLIEQLCEGGKVIAPVIKGDTQELVLIEKSAAGLHGQVICEVLYVNLRGVYGTEGAQQEPL